MRLGYDIEVSAYRNDCGDVSVALTSELYDWEGQAATWLPHGPTPNDLQHVSLVRPLSPGDRLDDAEFLSSPPSSLPPERRAIEETLLRWTIKRLQARVCLRDEAFALGRYLYGRVFRDAALGAWNRARDTVARSNKVAPRFSSPLRCCLRIASPDLWRFPWEYLADADGFIVDGVSISLIRQPKVRAEREICCGMQSGTSVFHGHAEPNGKDKLDAGLIKAWDQAWDTLSHKGTKTRIAQCSLSTIQTACSSAGHFVGLLAHGQATANGTELLLCAEGSTQVHRVSEEDLGNAVRQAKRVPKCVMLNVCWSANGDAGLLDGLAQKVQAAGVGIVVSMQYPVTQLYSQGLAVKIKDIAIETPELDVTTLVDRSRKASGASGIETGSPVVLDDRRGAIRIPKVPVDISWGGGSFAGYVPEGAHYHPIESALTAAWIALDASGGDAELHAVLSELKSWRRRPGLFMGQDALFIGARLESVCRRLDKRRCPWWNPLLIVDEDVVTTMRDQGGVELKWLIEALHEVAETDGYSDDTVDSVIRRLKQQEPIPVLMNLHELLTRPFEQPENA